ncbi:hypothetical protein PDN39_27545 [Bacillus cereus]|nr:hypothetical protein [Bacillus cereus]
MGRAFHTKFIANSIVYENKFPADDAAVVVGCTHFLNPSDGKLYVIGEILLKEDGLPSSDSRDKELEIYVR